MLVEGDILCHNAKKNNPEVIRISGDSSLKYCFSAHIAVGFMVLLMVEVKSTINRCVHTKALF